MEGLVLRVTGNDCRVRISTGEIYDCKVKGKFRIKGIKSTNPVSVGDRVLFDMSAAIQPYPIYDICERKNYVVRKPTNLSRQLHIIAANVDLAALIVTIAHPETSTVFIDRFLATCEAYNVKAAIVINKTDLYDEYEKEYMDALRNLYETIGYEVYTASAATGEGVDRLKERMKGNITLLSGNSGVGKSTLINAISPNFAAKIGEISTAHDSGMHTTTFSEMYELDNETFIIDTPGIRGFGTIDFNKYEVGHYFPEIFETSKRCRFDNCTHTHEPGCAVRDAISEHLISESRYNSYLSILEDEDEGKYRTKP